jgi:ketosteroid isomerase-like protein
VEKGCNEENSGLLFYEKPIIIKEGIMNFIKSIMGRRQFLIASGVVSACALTCKKLGSIQTSAAMAAENAATAGVKSEKKQNYDLVKNMITSQYWLPENRDMFSGDFTLELPNAPPGMPQYFNPEEFKLYTDWLSRTVKTWKVNPGYEIYGTPNENLFWVVRECSGDVRWAGADGKFESRMVSRITTEKGRIKHMNELSDPLSFLKAIGAEIPIFRVKMDHEEIKKVKDEAAKNAKPAAPMDNSPSAVAKRLSNNLAVYRDALDYSAEADMMTLAENCEWRVWFLPPEMKAAYYGDEKIGIDIWTARSVISYKYMPGAVIYETDDPSVYFIECGGNGISEWQGNNVRGAYRNRYVMFDQFENGALIRHHEYLNPVNKFNSINKSIPSFPYYF